MRLLILGGSGVLSTDFVKTAIDHGNDVTIVNRGKRKLFIDKRAKLVTADLRNESVEILRNKFASKYDVIIDFLSMNCNNLQKTLEVVQDCFEQYIFISSATVYKKNSENEIITENTEVGNTLWHYAIDKAKCEKFLQNSKVNYTIVRPYVTYGVSRIPFPIIPDVKHYTLIQRMKIGKPVLLFEDGNATCTLTHTKDFAEILYKLLLNRKCYRNDFHITSSQTQSWKDVYLKLCKILDVNPNYISVEINAIKKYLPEYEAILLGDKGTNMRFDNSKVLNVIGGYNFKISLDEGLNNSINFYFNTKEMQLLDYKWDGRIDYFISKAYGINNLSIMKNDDDKLKERFKYYIMRYELLRSSYDLIVKQK